MKLRLANVADSNVIATVLRRSIIELCVLDHGGDEHVLEQWLKNKTPSTIKSWIEDPDQFLVVAEDQGIILGVGGASTKGEITLNYVHPDYRYTGVSKAIISFIESKLCKAELRQTTLTSTQTALNFYKSLGYRESAGPLTWGKLVGYSMEKLL
jgi:N-acetylglutamate synthase-like GNAT family acetyltransferase